MPSDSQKPVGEPFARVYLERGAPTQDSVLWRNRLQAYLLKNHVKDYGGIASYLKVESGLVVETIYQQAAGLYYDYPNFFSKSPITDVLTAITFIWRYLYHAYSFPDTSRGIGLAPAAWRHPQAEAWQQFVSRALREENMAYAVDEKCGVHYFVDEEFERNRVSALACLTSGRYVGVKAAFEDAHKHLDSQPPDTKAACRSTFEAVEILARLILPGSKNLHARLVTNQLKALALAAASDAIEADTIGKIFDGVAQWTDGLHNYRHGQGVEKAIAPSLSLAVYVVSTGAAMLRWLVEIDAKQIGAAKTP